MRIYRAQSARGGIGFLYLAQDLRFADHHRIQAGGDTEDVLDGFQLLVFEDVGFVFAAAETEVFAHEALQVAGILLGAGKDLHPVAGGDDHRLLHALHGSQLAQGIGQARLRNRKTLPHVHWRGLVVDPQYEEIHGVPNLCSLLI